MESNFKIQKPSDSLNDSNLINSQLKSKVEPCVVSAAKDLVEMHSNLISALDSCTLSREDLAKLRLLHSLFQALQIKMQEGAEAEIQEIEEIKQMVHKFINQVKLRKDKEMNKIEEIESELKKDLEDQKCDSKSLESEVKVNLNNTCKSSEINTEVNETKNQSKNQDDMNKYLQMDDKELGMYQKLTNHDWKIRKSAYHQIRLLFQQYNLKESQEINTDFDKKENKNPYLIYKEWVTEMIIDLNQVAQLEGLNTLLVYIQNANEIKSIMYLVIPNLFDKVNLSKTNFRDIVMKIFTTIFHRNFEGIIISELTKRFNNTKNTKISETSINITKSLITKSIDKINLPQIFTALNDALISHHKNIKEAAIDLLNQIYIHTHFDIPSLLSKLPTLKSSQKQSLKISLSTLKKSSSSSSSSLTQLLSPSFPSLSPSHKILTISSLSLPLPSKSLSLAIPILISQIPHSTPPLCSCVLSLIQNLLSSSQIPSQCVPDLLHSLFQRMQAGASCLPLVKACFSELRAMGAGGEIDRIADVYLEKNKGRVKERILETMMEGKEDWRIVDEVKEEGREDGEKEVKCRDECSGEMDEEKFREYDDGEEMVDCVKEILKEIQTVNESHGIDLNRIESFLKESFDEGLSDACKKCIFDCIQHTLATGLQNCSIDESNTLIFEEFSLLIQSILTFNRLDSRIPNAKDNKPSNNININSLQNDIQVSIKPVTSPDQCDELLSSLSLLLVTLSLYLPKDTFCELANCCLTWCSETQQAGILVRYLGYWLSTLIKNEVGKELTVSKWQIK